MLTHEENLPHLGIPGHHREKFNNSVKMKIGKYNSICHLTETDRQKAISELNESDDLERRVSSLRDKIKASDWFNTVFEERLDDQYLTRYLRVGKMDGHIALERIRKMFALQKGLESRFTVCRSTDWKSQRKFPLIPGLGRYEIPNKNGMKCLVILRLHQLKKL